MTPTALKPGDVPAQLDDLPDGTVVTSMYGVAYQLCDGKWWGFLATTGRPTLPVYGGPYTVRYAPEGTQAPDTVEVDSEQIAEEVVVSGNSILIDGCRFPWFVRENPQVIPLDSEMVALQVAIIADRVTIQSNIGES